jgi:HD-GYP domain-containing protein (c-di-GMP phosphodiesterase class II)
MGSSALRDLPSGARFYILVLFGSALAIALSSAAALAAQPALLPPTILLTALMALCDLFPIRQVESQTEVSTSTALKLAAVLLAPLAVLLLAVFAGTLLSEWRLKRSGHKLLCNVGALTVTYTVVALAYHGLAQPGTPLLGSVFGLLALAVMGGLDVTVNSLLIAMGISLARQLPLRYVWAEALPPGVRHELNMLPLGVFMALLWRSTPWTVLLAGAPLYLMWHSEKKRMDLERATLTGLQALAQVLDERDGQTATHSECVSHHARAIALALRLPANQVDAIARAAWLHDIGKIGMPDAVLFKPSRLTAAERELAQRHARLGGDLLASFSLFREGADYVLHHHEWWNGTGYPDGLRGKRIPLGARVLSVADAFQAMTEARPYHAPRSEGEALAELRRGAGTQFDPQVVEAFLRAKGATLGLPESPVELAAQQGFAPFSPTPH